MFSDITNFKKSEILTNKPKWLIMTQSVLCGNQDLEIRSDVSSFSGRTEKNMKETKSLNTFIQNRIVESSRGQQSLCWPKKLKSLPIKS